MTEETLSFRKRLVRRLIYAFSWFRYRFTRKRRTVTFPTELLPLLRAASIVVAYCDWAKRTPEELKLSRVFEDLAHGKISPEQRAHALSALKAPTSKDLVGTVLNWLIYTGDITHNESDQFLRSYHGQRLVS